MKYASPYYRNKDKFSRSLSNMNRLAWHIEKWQKQFRFKRKYHDFDYEIMMDRDVPFDKDKFEKLEHLFNQFCKEMRNIKDDSSFEHERTYYQDYYDDVNWADFINTKINWGFYYDKYLEQAKSICPDPKERANYAVEICYKKYPNKNKKFIWIVAADGILQNLKQQKIILPIECDSGKYEYLGRYYDLVEVVY